MLDFIKKVGLRIWTGVPIHMFVYSAILSLVLGFALQDWASMGLHLSMLLSFCISVAVLSTIWAVLKFYKKVPMKIVDLVFVALGAILPVLGFLGII